MKKKPTTNNFPQSASSGERDISTETCRGGSLAQSGIHDWTVVPQGAPVAKKPPANAGDIGDAGSIPGSGRSPGKGHGNPLSILAWRIQWTEEPGRL